MKIRLAAVPIILLVFCASHISIEIKSEAKAKPEITMVIHGGAGTITRDKMTPNEERELSETLTEALERGMKILRDSGTSLDAVEASIRVLEDSPLFNAGKGAVFTTDGKNELDASIMDGSTLKAGAVASVTTIKNPITAARAVMEKTKHVLLIGEGADRFAAEQGLEIVDPKYFFEQKQWDALQKAKHEQGSSMREPEHRPFRTWHRGGACPRFPREPRRGHVHGRTHEQDARTHRRFADHWRGYLREQQNLRGVGHRPGRVLHSIVGRARRIVAHGVQGVERRESGEQSNSRQADSARRDGRDHRARP